MQKRSKRRSAEAASKTTRHDAAQVQLDEALARKLVLKLMALPGPSGREGAVVEFLQRALRDSGVAKSSIHVDDLHRRSPAGGEVGNLICRLPGTVRAPRRLFMAHMDTVPLCVGSRPLVRKNHVHSANLQTALGADNRAGVAVLLVTLLHVLHDRRDHPPLVFFWPVQEEIGMYGARFVRMKLLARPRLCFNFDGGRPWQMMVGATGDDQLQIDVFGRASHAGTAPDEGISAIAIASRAISALTHDGWHGRIVKGRNQGTSNIGVIRGGDATNVVTPRLTLQAEARSHDPRFRSRIVEAYRRAFQRAVQETTNHEGRRGTVKLDERLCYEAFRLPDDEPCVQEAAQAIRSIGLTPHARVVDGGLDANWLTARGLPTVTLGCGQSGGHTVQERLDLNEFLQACQVALQLATG